MTVLNTPYHQPFPDTRVGQVGNGYYVHLKDGDDSWEGTSEKPLKTISKAIDKLVPGYTIWIKMTERSEIIYVGSYTLVGGQHRRTNAVKVPFS